MNAPLLFVVIPWLDESTVVDEMVPRFLAALGELTQTGQVDAASKLLLVDDGSADDTLARLQAWAARQPEIEVLALGRNIGQQAALVQGLRRARAGGADVVVTMDCDGQDDPAAIQKMVAAYRAGDAVVYGVRNDRSSDGFFRRLAALFFYRLMGWFGSGAVYNHAEFRLMSAEVVDAVIDTWQEGMFLRALVPKLGFRGSRVDYQRRARVAGTSHYGFGQLVGLSCRALGEALRGRGPVRPARG